MHASEVNRIRNEIRRLLLAEQDMKLVAAGAELLGSGDAVPSERLIEAGLVVVYCRPFSGPPKDGVQPIRTEVDALALTSHLHAKLFDARNELYAHTQRKGKLRQAVDVFGGHSYAEEYPILNRDLLQPISFLARALADRFRKARLAREEALRAAGAPTADQRNNPA